MIRRCFVTHYYIGWGKRGHVIKQDVILYVVIPTYGICILISYTLHSKMHYNGKIEYKFNALQM